MLFRKFTLSLLLASVIRAAAPSSDSGDDNYYLVYLKNTNGEYKVYQNSKNQKRDASQLFVENTVDKINDLILSNKKTYDNQNRLSQIESSPKMDSDVYDESNFVYPISSVGEKVVLLAYLSKQLSKEILSMPNVLACVQDKLVSAPNSNYNTSDILKETGWSKLSVRENADLHLSLMSQGKQTDNTNKAYDDNYYYPASAGKDTDIIILDTSFNFNYKEFSNTNERTLRCVGQVVDGVVVPNGSCGSSNVYHGEKVSDCAAGLVHGIANRANVYGIQLPLYSGYYSDSDILGGLQYIYEKMVKSSRTVVNLSLSGYYEKYSDFYNQYETVVKRIIAKDGIIVSSAGNNGRDLSISSNTSLPCEFESVICVGGINNNSRNYSNVYRLSGNTNYGGDVNIYAPYYADVEYINNGRVVKQNVAGTSFSSPIVAGIISTILSEFPEKRYNYRTVLEVLKNYGKNQLITFNTVEGTKTGVIANNGKRSFKGDNIRCGNGFGRCAPGQCCSSTGYCGTSSEYCSTSKGCQLAYGDCKCGSGFGSCAPGQCCSAYNYCGTTSDYCSASKGCQLSYGDCKCGSGYGNCPSGKCCSKYNYCGSTSDYCGLGCNSSFGACSR